MRWLKRVLMLLAVAGLVSACSDEEVKVDDKPGCIPGSTQVCHGPGACAGAQVCNDAGTAFGVCDCGMGGGGTGGTSGSGMAGSGGGEQAESFPMGNVYVAASRNARVFEYTSDLMLVSSWTHTSFGEEKGAPGQSHAVGPAGMVFDASGNLVVAGVDEFCVFSKPGEELGCHPKIKSQATENIIFDIERNLYTTTATGGTDEVHKYDSYYQHVTTFQLPTGNLTGVTCDPDGNLYFASQLGNNTSRIYKVDKTNVANVLDQFDISGDAEGLQFTQDGNILVGRGANMGILLVEASSPTVVVNTITHENMLYSVPLTVDNNGLIYTADYENGSGSAKADLFVFDSSGALKASAFPSEVYGPFGITVAGVVLPCGAFQGPK